MPDSKTKKAAPPKESLLSESRKHGFTKRKIIIGTVALIVCVWGARAAWQARQAQASPDEGPPTYTVETMDLRSVVSSDGNVINPNIVNLSFLVNGLLDKVYVEEGQRITAGKVLAELDKREFRFDLQSAENDVRIARANIAAKQAELTDTDLKVAEKELIISRQTYESTKRDLEQAIDQAFDSAQVQIESAFSEIEESLQSVDRIMGIERYQNTGGVMVRYTFNNALLVQDAENGYEDVRRSFNQFRQAYLERRQTLNRADISRSTVQTTVITRSTQDLLDMMITLLKSARPNASVSASEVSSARSDVESRHDKITSRISSLVAAKQDIDTALLNQQNDTEAALNDLKNTEIKLDNNQQIYQQRNVNKEADLSILYAQLQQAQLQIDRAKYNLDLATLTAPINGEIIQLNGSEGETIKAETTSSENAFIKILSDSNFTTEVFVEEVDIAQIELGQKVIITLDAIPDVELKGSVSFVSSTANTDNNDGIVTYLVRIDIIDDKGAPIREGMTTYVDFVLGEAVGALAVPASAVRRDRFVTLADGTEREIQTGFSDGEMVEITGGLAVGDEILLTSGQPGATGARSAGTGRPGGGQMSDERLQRLKDAGFTDEEIKQLQNGQFTDAMREKMRAMRDQGGGSPFGGGSRGRR